MVTVEEFKEQLLQEISEAEKLIKDEKNLIKDRKKQIKILSTVPRLSQK